MKAVVVTKYGSPEVLKMVDVQKPTPADTEILLKIHASSVTSGDARLRRADPFIIRLIFGFKRPRKSVLGVVVAGEVEAIGKGVSRFKVGDKVFGTCGMSFGAHAQYQVISQDGTLALMPEDMSYEDAAGIPFGATASQHFLRKGNLKQGQNILVYGASGALGTMAVQLAKERGAHVTAVCSTRNIEMVKSLGADRVVDYTKTDFAAEGIQYDMVYDTIGKSSFSDGIRVLNKGGVLLLASAGIGEMFKGALYSIFSSKKVISGVIKETAEDMNFFKKLIEAGKLRAVLDSVYPLSAISEAHRKVDGGHKSGNVILKIEH